MSILIDSSSWIDFLRGGEAAAPAVVEALRDGKAAMTEPVWAELWAGARGRREEAFLDGARASCLWLAVNDTVWERCYELGRRARKRGLNCPFAVLLIAACARSHGAALLHSDKHFDALLKLQDGDDPR